MSRKNKKSKYVNQHQKNLLREQMRMQKKDPVLKQTQLSQEQFENQKLKRQSGFDMEIETPQKRQKISKHKIIGRKGVLQEKKKMRKYRKAPILVNHEEEFGE